MLFFVVLCVMAKNVELKAKVCDAETGEVLEFVNVSAQNARTMTNAEGRFVLNVDEEAMVEISYVGFQTINIKANKVGKLIKMKPMILREVKVIAWEHTLAMVSKKLNKEYQKRESKDAQYFFRMTTAKRKKQLVEAFVQAKSAVNLRDIKVVKGRYGQLSQDGLTRPAIANMNFHHPLELGPLVQESKFWQFLITPFSSPNVKQGAAYSPTYTQRNTDMGLYAKRLMLNYDVTGEELVDEGGNNIYKITFAKKDKVKRTSILTGVLYVNSKTLEMLRFDGRVENIWLDYTHEFYVETAPIELEVHINYTHERGFTEIASMSNLIKNKDMSSHCVLYNVDKMNLGLKTKKVKKSLKDVNDNVLEAVDGAGFDEELWAKSNIVQRTEEEEALACMPNQSAYTNEMLKMPESPMAKLVDHLERFGKTLPQEKVYLHMDNTCYFAGDTIWFSAYTRQTSDGSPSKISGLLYVELYNNEGYLVERKNVQIINGRGCGNFVLDKKSYGGYYELRAYTRWQLNWGAFERESALGSRKWFLSPEMHYNYFRDYDKLYSRVFPVYDAPLSEGYYEKEMTVRRLRTTYMRDYDTREITLNFFPEGGNLVEGIPCRVAFEACWSDGQEAYGELMRKVEKKKKVADENLVAVTKTENRGRGVFEITPDKDLAQEYVFVASNGDQVKAKLPKALSSGVSLSVDALSDSLVAVRIRISENLAPDSLGLTIMREGVMQKFVKIESFDQTVKLNVSDLKAGVNQATVFDTNGRVWADRLFFVKNADAGKNAISVKGVKDKYTPYEKIELDIQAPSANGSMSLAVRDASHSDVLYDNASILTEMLLTSEIKGFVENPEWFFEKDDALHRRGLDLLMMTQGWRRFDWREMAVKDVWKMRQPAERTQIITGKVYDVSQYNHYNDIDFMVDGLEYKLNPERFIGEISDSSNIQNVLPDDINDNVYTDDYNDEYKSWQHNIQEIMYKSDSKADDLTDVEYMPGDAVKHFKNKAIRVHAEVVSLDGKEHGSVDCDTKDGRFKFQMPNVYGEYVFFLSAADTLEWKGNKYVWIQMANDEDLLPEKHKRKYRVFAPDYSPRISFPYPRFVNSYNYYQTRLNYSYDPALKPTLLADGSINMDEVQVWSRHSSIRTHVDSIPALIMDAYDAYNEVLDAGLKDTGTRGVARVVVGDYGLAKSYNYNGNIFGHRYGYDKFKRIQNNMTLDPDSIYLPQNLKSFAEFSISEMDTKKWFHRSYIDKFVLYSDYFPRLRGSKRYFGANLPATDVAVYPIIEKDEGSDRRAFYRDRRYIMHGFSYVNEFYNPDYSKRKLKETPKDYRRTLYWNPYLSLDEKGHAKVMFWNNSTGHRVEVDAEGMSSQGVVWTNEK